MAYMGGEVKVYQQPRGMHMNGARMKWMIRTAPLLAIAACGAIATAQYTVVAQFEDLDGDGVISDAEFGAQARDDLVTMVRKHSDGYLITDRAAIIAGMKAYLLALAGDFDGDGEVTVSDLVAQVAASGSVEPTVPGQLQGDLNGDGVVDAADILLANNALGRTVSLNDEQIDVLWAALLDAAEDHSLGPTREEVFEVPRGDPHRGPDGHNQIITSSWPPPPPSIQGPPPRDWDWPANHLGAVSSTWGNESHGSWPANHGWNASATWGVHDPDNHYHSLSMQDNPNNPDQPPNSSDGWPEGHSGPVSATWQDSPGHDALLSQSWPAGHQLPASNSGVLGQNDHIGFISASWDAAGHIEATSATWPANHQIQISMRWTDHNTTISGTWPPNHLRIISQSWPVPPPAGWPANHFMVVSRSWMDVSPGDHDWLATLGQDYGTHPGPRIPGIMLDLWLRRLR